MNSRIKPTCGIVETRDALQDLTKEMKRFKRRPRPLGADA